MSCLLHLVARPVNVHTYAHTNKHGDAAAMHVNELSMEQWQSFILMNINEGMEDGG